MHYVKQFHINGVDTKQVACIELHGKPNAATEGYVGVLGIDMDSPLHDVYKCVAVNGSIYTWELLSSGLSVIVSDVLGSGAETVDFPYDKLKTPSLYVVKIGDSILDGEGYLYQVVSIGSSSCVAKYCGIHIVKYGMSAYGLAVEQGFDGSLEEWLESLESSVYIRYSAYADGTDYTAEWSRGQRYIGVCGGNTPPTKKTDFVWSRFDAGVYVGSGEMPEWCDLQIDPEGDVTEIVQTPGQSTSNMMSQKAVSDSFANALKGSASGEVVALNDVSPIAHEMGVTVKSKNILPYPYYNTTKTQLGITFTDNGDGSITANGTATGDAEFVLAESSPYEDLDVICISGCPAGGSADTYYISSLATGQKDIGNGCGHLGLKRYFRFRIIIKSGYTANNLVFLPMIEMGKTKTAYAPYIKDFSAVTVSATGKNLFDVDNTSVTMSNATYTQDGNSYTVKGNAGSYNGGSSGRLYIKLPHKLKRWASKKDVVEYTVSLYVTLLEEGIHGPTFFAFCRDETNETATRGKNVEMQLGERVRVNFQLLNAGGSELKDLVFYLNNNKMLIELDTLQIEVGENVTEQEPYNGTTYPVSADGTVEGVKSIYPCTTLMTDTAGAVIDCNYNRDLNKAFLELQQAILALGV